MRFGNVLVKIIGFFLRHTIYKCETLHTERVPKKGGVLLVANHVSLFDFAILSVATKRPIHFMVYESFFKIKVINFFLKLCGAWKVPDGAKSKEILKLRNKVRAALQKGEVVAIFPEGQVSSNGVTKAFKSSLKNLLGQVNATIIPVRIGMLRGSFLNLADGKLRFNRSQRPRLPISVSFGNKISSNLSGFEISQVIHNLGAEAEIPRQYDEMPIHFQMMRNAKTSPLKKVFYDAVDGGLSNFEVMLRVLLLSRKIKEMIPNEEEFIGVMLPNCVNTVITTLGVMWADKSPAIINYTTGKTTRDIALNKAKIKHIFTSRKFLEKLQMEESSEMVILEDLAKKITRFDRIKMFLTLLLVPRRIIAKCFAAKSWNDVHRCAVLLFSSGSSGVPKGVALSHRNVNADYYSFFRVISWTNKDSIVGNLPLFHAFGMNVAMWIPIMSQAKVVYITNPLDAEMTGKTIEKHKLTILTATPTFLQTYMRRCTAQQFSSLRMVITGAEKLRADISERFSEMMNHLTIVEGYGCTELSPLVSMNLASSTHLLGRFAGKKGSIGVAMPGIMAKVIDIETGKELPPNKAGKLMIKGGLVMQGYLNDPEATAKVIKDGFYDTGDIAEMDESGFITITGRLSRFSKISGEMVPHEVIETRLNELTNSDRRLIVISGIADIKRGEKLIVFYAKEDLNIKDILEGLRKSGLSNLWIPRLEDFHFVEEIPMLGSGKLDLQGLKTLTEKFAK